MNWSTCKINVTGHLILTGLKKQLYHNCWKEMVSAYVIFIINYYMTVATTTLTGLYKDVYLPRLGLVKPM